MAGGGAAVTLGAAPFAAAAHQGRNAVERTRRDGFFGGVNELTGLDNQGDSDFDMDGNRKGTLEASADRFKAGRFGVRGGYQKAAGLMKTGGKMMLEGAKKIAPKAVVDAATKAVTAILNSKVIKKYIGEAAIKQIATGFAKELGKKAAKSAAVQGAKKILGVLSGGIGLAIFAAADFVAGMANAKRYFKLGPGEKATLGMRIASGVAAALSGLAMGLIPIGWLAQMAYKIVATKTDKDNLDAAQERTRQRAAQLSEITGTQVDPDKLNEVENRTLGQKFGDLLPGGKKRRNNREASLLGMSPEEYEDWKKKRDAYDKGELAQTEDTLAAQRDLVSNRLTTTGSSTSAEVRSTGVINGYASEQIAGGAGRNENFMDIPFLEKLAETNKSIDPVLLEAREIASGERKEFSAEAKQILKFNGLPFLLTVSKLDAEVSKVMTGVGMEEAQQTNDAKAGDEKKKKEKFDLVKSAFKLYGQTRNIIAHAQDGIGKFIGNVGAGFTKAGLNIKKGFDYATSGKLKEDVFKKAGEIKDNVVGAVTGTFDAVKNALSNAFDYVKSGKLVEDIKQVAMDAFNAVKDFIKNAFLGAVEGVKNFGKGILEGGKNILDSVVNFGKNTVDSIRGSAQAGLDEAYATDSAGRDRQLIDGGKNLLDAAKAQYNQSMGTGGADAMSPFDSILNSSVDSFKSSLSALTGNSSGGGTSIGSGNAFNFSASYAPGVPREKFDPEQLNSLSPQNAGNFFYAKSTGGLNQYLEQLAKSDPKSYEQLFDRFTALQQPGGQNHGTDGLEPRFKNKVDAFLNDPALACENVKVREGRRSPLTQLAYYAKGRMRDLPTLNRMWRKAGFGCDAWSPDKQNTQTIGSLHFSGNAIDIEDNGRGVSFYRKIAPIAKKHGIEWGGDCGGRSNDPPHFQMPADDRHFATPVVSNTAIPSGTQESPTQRGDAMNPAEKVNITNDVGADYLKGQNSKIAEALDLNSLIKHSEKMTGILHGDNVRVIQLLEQTYNLHNQSYEDASPMYAYYKQQNGPASSSHKRMSNALSKYTGGESTSQGLDIPMETAAT